MEAKRGRIIYPVLVTQLVADVGSETRKNLSTYTIPSSSFMVVQNDGTACPLYPEYWLRA